MNARGGVHGEKVELISVDDRFDPKVTVQFARELTRQRGVLALFLNRGTPHAEALLPLLAEHKVPLVAPGTGAMVLHRPVNPWVFNVRATYQCEAAPAMMEGFAGAKVVVEGLRRAGLDFADLSIIDGSGRFRR
ncbi:hypothetical protein DY262_09255 [Hydrogenophaga borbori]|uniref:Leucine-binding protein domain-containing protein n=1 Tax=Hydrogenophaga borbori TaxID=2294117 RepID=A0A372EKH8_9BURK|nr:ABC transporter substrate-binding protein [Hydrogenophaga borbori]RFP79395.1 hypothetical protein DY262_09255 [Hydrogenophaga borbori]